jgi:hypothetical protein
LTAGQRRGELDDRVAPVVRPAVEAVREQRAGQEPPDQPFPLLGVEGQLGVLVGTSSIAQK